MERLLDGGGKEQLKKERVVNLPKIRTLPWAVFMLTLVYI